MLARTMHGKLAMSTRQKILQGMAECAWWMAWSDHAEEHRCVNLSGMEISEIAPPVPPEAFQLAEKALAKVEARILEHAPLADRITACKAACDDLDVVCECNVSPVCGALLAAAFADEDRHEYGRTEYALRFGRCIAYDLAGAGVSWSDDHAEIPWPDMYDSSMYYALFCLAEERCEHEAQD